MWVVDCCLLLFACVFIYFLACVIVVRCSLFIVSVCGLNDVLDVGCWSLFVFVRLCI